MSATSPELLPLCGLLRKVFVVNYMHKKAQTHTSSLSRSSDEGSVCVTPPGGFTVVITLKP